MKKYIIMALISSNFIACRSAKETSGTRITNMKKIEIGRIEVGISFPIISGGTASVSSPAVFVYKTKADYSHLVPVLMDGPRTRIVSYPHPRDLIIGGKLCLPTLLSNGYWLDNRGIGPNVAFLSYTYEEYAKLPMSPTMEELIAHIHDKYPLTEWHECGRRADYKNIVFELNKLIEQGFLQK